jgi:hypothetical protein
MRESFIFYRSFYEAIKELPLEDQGKMYSAIVEYVIYGKKIKFIGINNAIWTLIRPQLDANIKKYKLGKKHGHLGAKHGKKGGRPRGSKKPSKQPSKNPQETPTDPSKKPTNVNVNVNDNVNDIYTSNFLEFWEKYPRKKGKGAAYKSYEKVKNNHNDIMQGLKKYDFSDDVQFVPHPATWLNQRRWEDESDIKELPKPESDEEWESRMQKKRDAFAKKQESSIVNSLFKTSNDSG